MFPILNYYLKMARSDTSVQIGFVYLFFRENNFYPLNLSGDSAALAQAEGNPGTTKVVKLCTNGNVQTIWTKQSPKEYKSCAKWDCCPEIGNYTEDTHLTRPQAEAICTLLCANGFGGDKKYFPIAVWVEEIY